MLTIRREQFEEIGRRLAHRWEDTMVLHLETFFPERCAELGEKGVRESIDLGIKKSAKYDIYTERDVCKFLNFMFALGFDFDTDPEYPWANEILTNPALGRSNVKMHLLEKAADGDLEPDLEPLVPPSDAEIEAMRREAEALEAARMAAVAREDEEIRAAELARHPNGSGDSLTMGDGDGDTGEK